VAAGFSALSILLSWFWLHETLPEEKRGKGSQKSPFTLVAMLQALRKPYIGQLLILIFTQQIIFGGFQQMLALFTLSRLGLNASGNSIIFVFVGFIIVIMQGAYSGEIVHRFRLMSASKERSRTGCNYIRGDIFPNTPSTTTAG